MLNFLYAMNRHKMGPVDPAEALPGHDDYLYPLQGTHAVLGTNMLGDYPADAEFVTLGMGCFWGAERIMYEIEGVHTTAAVYHGGYTAHPTYDEVFSAKTGHTEAVLVAYTGGAATLDKILTQFWEQHDPTTRDRQGNDIGNEYRSAFYWTTPEQGERVRASAADYQAALTAAGRGEITTELRPADELGPYYFAEAEHQQYLAKNPAGYCNHGFNGVYCTPGAAAAAEPGATAAD